ncbi:MAG: NADP-specific glutamate dehydrogenase [Pseudomonadota bacterium]
MPDRYCLDPFIDALKNRAPGEDAFHQAVRDVARDIIPVINDTPAYQDACLLERLTEPDRMMSFRVAWERDDGSIAVNRAYRVQFNGAIGPYKGGLRFHPSVTPSVLKFLGFEQTFKNALTGLPMGGAKGGSDFDPSGCSDAEIERFCQAMMMELHRHIGPDRDVPAGDINVGAREIGYLFGAYRRITGDYQGVLTGKGLSYGGSEMRIEATGYGLIYFLREMLRQTDGDLDGQTIVISGAGNVATYAAEKAIALGSKVVALSDSTGAVLDKDGFTDEKLAWVRDLKSGSGGSLEDYADAFSADWKAGQTPWGIDCDIALPCAAQNEMDEDAARQLLNNGCRAIAEGANMPLTAGAKDFVRDSDRLFGPAKAANAGGVAVSGLEIWQNRRRRSAEEDDIAEALEGLMSDIHARCAEEGERKDGHIDYARGVNVAGFKTVADAMVAQGIG